MKRRDAVILDDSQATEHAHSRVAELTAAAAVFTCVLATGAVSTALDVVFLLKDRGTIVAGVG
jgi:hypothetical protein